MPLTTTRQRESVLGPLGQLAVTVETPRFGASERWALFCHGFGSRKEFKPLAKLSTALAERQWGVIRFDFAGNGESEGDFGDTSFRTQQEDVRAIFGWAVERGWTPDLLLGHSLGGATLLSLGAELANATNTANDANTLAPRLLVTLGAPADTSHLGEFLVEMAPEVEQGDIQFPIAGVPRRITPQLVHVLRTTDFSDAIRRLPQRLLVLQPEHDEMIPATHAHQIEQLANQEGARVTIPGADHLLGSDDAVQFAIEHVLAFVG